MSTTLLTAVNDVLKRVGEISQGSPVLTSLTDSARQSNIDIVVQLWQTIIEQLQGWADLPGDVGSGSITLATGTREYATESDFQAFVGDDRGVAWLVCASPVYRIPPYVGGYKQMFADQPDPSIYTGQPGSWAYNPVTSKIRLDRAPTSTENGQVLGYLYDKTVTLSAYTDTFPIPDAAVKVLVTTVAEAYRLEKRNRLNGNWWKVGIAEAARISSQRAKDSSYA